MRGSAGIATEIEALSNQQLKLWYSLPSRFQIINTLPCLTQQNMLAAATLPQPQSLIYLIVRSTWRRHGHAQRDSARYNPYNAYTKGLRQP